MARPKQLCFSRSDLVLQRFANRHERKGFPKQASVAIPAASHCYKEFFECVFDIVGEN